MEVSLVWYQENLKCVGDLENKNSGSIQFQKCHLSSSVYLNGIFGNTLITSI